jgi:hypothetical protein
MCTVQGLNLNFQNRTRWRQQWRAAESYLAKILGDSWQRHCSVAIICMAASRTWDFFLHQNTSLFTVTFGEIVLTLAKSHSS